MDIKAKPKDRQPSSNISGSPKKGGGGGKGTWGKGGIDDLKAVTIKDSKDPNYDSEEEDNKQVVIAKTEVNTLEELIQEFLSSGDVQETIRSLKDLHVEVKPEQFIKKTIIRAMEKQAYERELVSKLLLAIYNVAVTPEQLAEGFQAALDSLEDIILDNPDAVDTLSKFLARAIFDEVVAPAFLKNATLKSALAGHCIASADVLLNQPFRSERLAHVWGAGDLTSAKRLKEEAILLFEEFLTNGDFREADRSMRELNAHFFHPQIVKQALRIALTKEEEDRKKILSLLAFFTKEVLISPAHMKEGFTYCCESLDDLKLDVPNAPTILSSFIKTSKAEGWLDSSFEEPKI